MVELVYDRAKCGKIARSDVMADMILDDVFAKGLHCAEIPESFYRIVL